MRAGLFGGTFNPIHRGHLMVADQVVQHLLLDRLYIIPCRVPPHKLPTYLAPAAQRMRMIQLALPLDPRFRLSDVEIRRDGPSFTIDTANHFLTRVVPGATLFLIMGMDAFLELHTWKSRRKLLKAVQPVVVTRSVEGSPPSSDAVGWMDSYIRAKLSDDYRYRPQQHCWQDSAGACIHLLPTPPLDISSSQVRAWIRAGKTVSALVPPAVCTYIEQEELYR